LSDVTANIGSGSSLTAALKVGTDSANLGSGSGLTANLKEAGVVSGYSTEYQTVYDSFTTPPSAADATIQDTWVTALVAASLWDTKKDVQYNFAIHTNDDGEAQTNWLNPGTYDCTLVNAPTFTAYEGFTGDGATSYIDSNWIPSDNGVYFAQNSDSMVIYSRSDVDEGGASCGARGVSVLAFTTMYAKLGSDTMRVYNNSTGVGNGANTDSLGMYIATRTASNAHHGYKNGGNVFSDTDASWGLTTVEFYILCYNYNGTPTDFTTRQHSCCSFGASYDQTEVTNETNNFETYMDANGKGVIP